MLRIGKGLIAGGKRVRLYRACRRWVCELLCPSCICLNPVYRQNAFFAQITEHVIEGPVFHDYDYDRINL